MNWILMPFINCWDLTLHALEDCLAQSVPTRILLIDQGSDNSTRQACDDYIDARKDQRVLCWHYRPKLPSLSAVWNRALNFVWELGGTEALVVNNDVRLHRHTVEVLKNCLYGTQSLFVSAVGVKEGQYDPNFDAYTVSSGDRGGPDFSCFLISQEGHTKYPFDEGFVPAFCEDLDAHRRYMLGGDGARIFSVNLPFLHLASQTIKAYSPEARATFNRQYDQCRAYYARKWGGGINQEFNTIPFDPSSAREGVTTPELQRRVQAGEPVLP